MRPKQSSQAEAGFRHRSAVFLPACFLALIAVTAQAQTLTVLHNFTSKGDGGIPYAGITFDQQGRIYGTTTRGGAYDEGVVYRLERQGEGWSFEPIYSFGSQNQDGASPYAGVVFGPDGLLYGTTEEGGNGYGTVFSLQPPAVACKAALCPWTETVIHRFNGTDGAYPEFGNLVFDQAGNLYGTTFNSGAGNGLVFELSRSGSSWTESVIWQFTGGNDGSYPSGGVVLDKAGNLYGTTGDGGSGGAGTVYELSPAQSGWTESTLYAFNAETGVGDSGLIWDARGNLYGITGLGFTGEGIASAYELTPQANGSWSFTLLYAFGEQRFTGPVATVTLDSQGNLYGPLPSGSGGYYGAIFRLMPSGDQWLYNSFYQFTSCNDGCTPLGAVTFDANGNMYGTAEKGGTGGNGTVWEITP